TTTRTKTSSTRTTTKGSTGTGARTASTSRSTTKTRPSAAPRTAERATTATTAGETAGAATAADVALRNEVLAGKVRDRNLHYLARELRALGTPLVLALIVPDEIDAIVRALGWARAQADVVLTTGGVGPTHDDVTLEAVAQAFGLGLCPDP